MSNILLTADGVTSTLAPIILSDDVNVYDIPKRSYDFTKGDRRFFDFANAVRFATDEAVRTGIRQVVRLDVDVLGKRPHLVQAVGS
jgi:hypothetical protein